MNGKKTLYDLLEVSKSASTEAIHASFARLTEKFDAGTLNSNSGLDVQSQYHLIKDAFVTLGNPAQREAYDKRLAAAAAPPAPSITYYEDEPNRSTGMKIIIGTLIVAAALYAYKTHRDSAVEAARLEAESKQAELDNTEKQREIEALALQRQAQSLDAQQTEQQRTEMQRARYEADQNSRRLENKEAQYKREDERKRQDEERKLQNAAREAQYRADRERQQAIRSSQQQDYGRPRGAVIENQPEKLSPNQKHSR